MNHVRNCGDDVCDVCDLVPNIDWPAVFAVVRSPRPLKRCLRPGEKIREGSWKIIYLSISFSLSLSLSLSVSRSLSPSSIVTTGTHKEECSILDEKHVREIDVEASGTPLSLVMFPSPKLASQKNSSPGEKAY